MKKICWNLNEELYSITEKYNLKESVNQYSQYEGDDKFYVKSWEKHIIGVFPQDILSLNKLKLLCTPQNIIRCFQQEEFLSALVLIVLWGTMVRTKNRIYTVDLKDLNATLKRAHNIIISEGDVKKAWILIRKQLNWSNVILSKYLHFAVRSVGYENPPVPIDNMIIRYKFWLDLKKFIKKENHDYKIKSWFDKDYSWEAYNNYMTVIIALADRYKVNTTRIENTIFGIYH